MNSEQIEGNWKKKLELKETLKIVREWEKLYNKK